MNKLFAFPVVATFFTLLALPAARANTCFPTLKPEQRAALPKCVQSPTGWTLPSHLNPTGSIFVNYEVAALDVLRAAAKYLEQHAPHVHVVLVVNKDMTYHEKYPAPENLQQFARKHLSKLKYTVLTVSGSDHETYLRDPFLGGMSNDGRPVIVGSPTDKRQGQYWEKTAKQCGYELKDYSKLASESIVEVLDGGNFVVLPGGIALADGPDRLKNHPQVPKDMGLEIERASKAFFGVVRQGQKLIVSSFDLPVLSHADEVLSVAKTGDGKCDFALIVGSTKLAVDLHPDKKSLAAEIKTRATRIQTNIDRSIGFAVAAIKKETGCADVKQVKLPLLPADPAVSDGRRSFDHANPVNGLVLTPLSGPSYFITAKTGIAAFDQHSEKALTDAGIPHATVDAEAISTGAGGIHCSTNQFQLCQP